jgi:hypothetical protein
MEPGLTKRRIDLEGNCDVCGFSASDRAEGDEDFEPVEEKLEKAHLEKSPGCTSSLRISFD